MNDEPKQPPRSESDQLALERTHMASSRTLLALIRTGSVIAGGGSLATEILVKAWPRWVVVVISAGFVFLGYGMMWSAVAMGKRLRARLPRGGLPDVPMLSHVQFVIMTVSLQVLIAVVVVLSFFGRGAK